MGQKDKKVENYKATLRFKMVKEMATHSSIFALGDPKDRGILQATVRGVAKELETT